MATERPLNPRVLQLVLSLNTGGTERLVIELVRRLYRDIAMAVVCLDEKGVWADRIEALGVDVTSLHRQAGFQPALGRRVARIAARHDAQVIHCHHYSPLVYGALARLWRPHAKVVFTEHGRLTDQQPSTKRRAANQLFARVPSASFAVTHELRTHLIHEGFHPDALGVIYNGIDVGPAPSPQDRTAIRHQLGVGDDVFVVGSIARLDPVKDLGTAIRATAAVAGRRPALLVIIGDGPEREALERLAAEVGQGCVRFLGQRDDAREWLAGCDAYVNSSVSEGASLTILEAMAAGLPVVATQVGGNPELVDESVGRLAPARHPDALAAALAALAANAALRATLAAAARARVVERFSLERMVRQYRDVYTSLS